VYGRPNDTGMYLYLDKVGCLKRSVEFGVSMRIQSAEDVLDSSKVWLVNAPEENYAYQKEINEYTREGE
jgi:hypothetical protein